ncbi:MAG: error-prone DNA polymerase [Myxococcota bacterium]
MFAELMARSSFSFLRGSSHPEELVLQSKALGLSALAITDWDGLYGAARAYAAGKEIGQRVIVGAELAVGLGARPRQLAPMGESVPAMPSLVLLVQNQQGYSNLCRLLTLAHDGLPKGHSRLELGWLSEHADGLFALIPGPRRPGDASEAPAELLRAVRGAFGERSALGMYRHMDGFDVARGELLKRWSAVYGIERVASARPFYHEPSRKPLLDVLQCIREKTSLDRLGTALDPNAEAQLRSETDMLKLFRDEPALVERSGEIAETLRFSLAELKYKFPCALAPGESADGKLRALTYVGLAERYPEGAPPHVLAQVEKELALIAEIEVAPYFLSTWEVVQIARERRILCQGRGSAANSAVCFALGITAVDPARSNLLFERFLSAERREPPDIDIDFEHERREEVIQELYQRYGRDRAAMVSEVICYRGRSALREVGKAFGLSLEQVDRLTACIGHWDEPALAAARLHEAGFDPKDSRIQRILELARQLAGFPRHLSIHVGGFVLSAAPLYDVAPVEPARMPDRSVVPWDKDDLDVLGFFKVDVLALGMLTAVRKALAMIHAGGGLRLTEDEAFDPIATLARVPVEDKAVYELVSRADTVGVFQIESRAQMAMLPRLRPKCFYDLVIEVAIVRPGPIQGGMVHPYLKRRNNEEPRNLPHPDLEKILDRTLGVPLFQEQVMQIAIVGAGYSGGEADQLRRDMAAWKRNGKLLRHRERLLEGFQKKGISREFGEALFEQIKGFGDYGFPESHAASFALLVYTSSWLKAYYPAHFACALLNAQPMGFYSPATILADARRHGVEVRDVDVTSSNWDSLLEPAGERSGVASLAPGARRAVRIGMRLVKGFSEAAAKRIEAARNEWRFSGIDDVARRAELRRDELEALAEAGAFESLTPGRRQALWQSRAPRLKGLFSEASWKEPSARLPSLRPEETLLFDYRRKGLSAEDHPMIHLRPRLKHRGILSAAELLQTTRRRGVSVAGVVICRQQPATASGVVFVTLEDETGFCNLVLWRRVFDEFRLVATQSAILLAEGDVERQAPGTEGEGGGAVVHLIARHLERLDVPGRDIQKLSRDFH